MRNLILPLALQPARSAFPSPGAAAYNARRFGLGLRTLGRHWRATVDVCQQFWARVVPYHWLMNFKPQMLLTIGVGSAQMLALAQEWQHSLLEDKARRMCSCIAEREKVKMQEGSALLLLFQAIITSDVGGLADTLCHLSRKTVAGYFYDEQSLVRMPGNTGIDTLSRYTALGCAVCMVRGHANPSPSALAVLRALICWMGSDAVNCMGYTCPELRSAYSPLMLLCNMDYARFQQIVWFFDAGFSPSRSPIGWWQKRLFYVGEGTRQRRKPYRTKNGAILDIWPSAWRHYHCMRAVTALIHLRRVAANPILRAVPRDVMLLVGHAVMKTRYNEQWDVDKERTGKMACIYCYPLNP